MNNAPNPLDSLQPWMAWTMGLSLLGLFFCIAFLVHYFRKGKGPNLDSVRWPIAPGEATEKLIEHAIESNAVSVGNGAVLTERARALLIVAGYTNDGEKWNRPKPIRVQR